MKEEEMVPVLMQQGRIHDVTSTQPECHEPAPAHFAIARLRFENQLLSAQFGRVGGGALAGLFVGVHRLVSLVDRGMQGSD